MPGHRNGWTASNTVSTLPMGNSFFLDGFDVKNEIMNSDFYECFIPVRVPECLSPNWHISRSMRRDQVIVLKRIFDQNGGELPAVSFAQLGQIRRFVFQSSRCRTGAPGVQPVTGGAVCAERLLPCGYRCDRRRRDVRFWPLLRNDKESNTKVESQHECDSCTKHRCAPLRGPYVQTVPKQQVQRPVSVRPIFP